MPNYDTIARAILEVVDLFDDDCPREERAYEDLFRAGVYRTAESLAYQLQLSDTEFDKASFYAACGLKLTNDGVHTVVATEKENA